ncbi:MAG: MATE family efflux transporter [Victivallaceae bacterium]|nr:MATE family efflux transporter [Victivallaceae bacterium]
MADAVKSSYLSGSIAGTMLKTGIAMLPGTLAMSGYNLADTYFVSRLGRDPLAAMGFTFPVVMLLGCVFHGVSGGVMTIAAQSLGGGRTEKARTLTTSGVLLLILVSLTVGVLGMVFCQPVMKLLGASERTLPLASEYMNIWFFGCVTSALTMTGNNLLMAVGDSRTASLMMVLGLIVNVILDPLLIFGWGPVPAMGMRGAALATVLAQFLAAGATLEVLRRKHKLIRYEIPPWRQMRSAWYLIVLFGVPMSLGHLMMPMGAAVMTWITSSFGDAAVAASAAAGRLEMVAFVFPMALGISLMPMVAQNYGAKQYERIRQCRKFSMRFAFLFLGAMAILFYLFRMPLTGIFSRDDEEVRRIMVMILTITPWCFGMIEIHRYSTFFYTGCGHPVAAAWLNVMRMIGLLVPFSLLALYLRSLEGLFFARLAADSLAGAIGFLLTRRLTRGLTREV